MPVGIPSPLGWSLRPRKQSSWRQLSAAAAAGPFAPSGCQQPLPVVLLIMLWLITCDQKIIL